MAASHESVAGSYALEHANRTAFLEHRQLSEVATHDGLTALLNRAAFEDQIRRVWQQAQRDRQTVAVIMIDIDCFKSYNDRYGHIAGDDCLRRVSTALRDAARRRPLDFVARYGGEELVAVLYGAEKAYFDAWSAVRATARRDSDYWSFVDNWSSPAFAHWVASIAGLLDAVTPDGPTAAMRMSFDRVVRFELRFWSAVHAGDSW